MRFVRGLLLFLFLLPAGAMIAPCCAEAIEACCPLDRACEESEACLGTMAQVLAVPVDAPPCPALPAIAPVFAALANVPQLSAALERPASAPARVPLRN